MRKITPIPISIRFDPEWLEKFDKWRTSQIVPLSRSAAIRVGVEMLMRSTGGETRSTERDGLRKKRGG